MTNPLSLSHIEIFATNRPPFFLQELIIPIGKLK